MTPNEILQSLPAARREDATWLLMGVLGVSRSGLLLAGAEPLNATQQKDWRRAWRRRRAGQPLQYALGRAPFYGREFLVDGRVLIPRPETEALVELCLGLLPAGPARVLDVGTGSGCIALTLAAERSAWSVTGSDFSSAALAVARANGRALGLPNARFLKADLFAPALARQEWDLLVSNPPYLDDKKDFIAADVRAWEPRLALVPEARLRSAALDRAAWCGQRILVAAAEARVGHTALELSPRVAALLERKWRCHPRVRRVWRGADLAGRKRFLLVAWEHA